MEARRSGDPLRREGDTEAQTAAVERRGGGYYISQLYREGRVGRCGLWAKIMECDCRIEKLERFGEEGESHDLCTSAAKRDFIA